MTDEQSEKPQEEAKSPGSNEPDQSKLAVKELSATRRGKLGHCTRKMNEISELLLSLPTPDLVNTVKKTFRRFS